MTHELGDLGVRLGADVSTVNFLQGVTRVKAQVFLWRTQIAELRSYPLSFPQVAFRKIKNVKNIVVYGLYVYCVYGPVVSCFCTLFHLVLTTALRDKLYFPLRVLGSQPGKDLSSTGT